MYVSLNEYKGRGYIYWLVNGHDSCRILFKRLAMDLITFWNKRSKNDHDDISLKLLVIVFMFCKMNNSGCLHNIGYTKVMTIQLSKA